MNKNSKVLIIIAMISALAFLSSSVNADNTYRQSDALDIRHSVRIDGAITTSALCNITIYNPNWLTLVNFKAMTNNSDSQTYNYTLPASNTTLNGNYCYDITCTQSGLNSTESFCVEINPSGKEFTTAQSIIYIFVLLLSLFILGLFLYGSYAIRWENMRNSEGRIIQVNYKKHLKIFFIVMSYMTIMWITYITYNISFAYLELVNVSAFFKVIYLSMLAFLFPIFVLAVVVGFVLYVQDLKLDKKLERGLTIK